MSFDLACTRCHRPLPGAESGVMVMGLPGVGIFHTHCKPTWRHWIRHRVHRLLRDGPIQVPA